MLENYQKLADQKIAAWEIAAYAQVVPPLLNALKSIAGKSFSSYREYKKWWDKEGAKFEVID